MSSNFQNIRYFFIFELSCYCDFCTRVATQVVGQDRFQNVDFMLVDNGLLYVLFYFHTFPIVNLSTAIIARLRTIVNFKILIHSLRHRLHEPREKTRKIENAMKITGNIEKTFE